MKTAALNNQWPKIKLNSFPQPAACERISTRGLLFWAKLSSCQAANLCRAGPSPEWRLERCHQSTAARRLHTPPRLRSPLSRSSTICIQEGYQLSKLSIISILMNDHYSKFLRRNPSHLHVNTWILESLLNYLICISYILWRLESASENKASWTLRAIWWLWCLMC